MTKQEFVAEGLRRGMDKEELRQKFESLDRAGKFSDSVAASTPKASVPAPVPQPLPEPPKKPVVDKEQQEALRIQATAPYPKKKGYMPGDSGPMKPTELGDTDISELNKEMQILMELEQAKTRDFAKQKMGLVDMEKAPSRKEWKEMGFDGRSSKEDREIAWKNAKAGVPYQTPFKESQDAIARSVVRRGLADPALSLSKGIVGIPEAAVGLADIAAAGVMYPYNLGARSLEKTTGADIPQWRYGTIGKLAEKANVDFKMTKEIINSLMSPETLENQKEVENAVGAVDTLFTALKNPSVIVDMGLESIPMMMAGGAMGTGALTSTIGQKVLAMAPKLAPLAAYAAGEALSSMGSTQEGFRQESEEGYTTGEQVGLSVGVGLATGLIAYLGGRASRYIGLEDVDQLIAGRVNAKDKLSIIEKAIMKHAANLSPATRKALQAGAPVAAGGLTEGLEEAGQGVMETVFTNLGNGLPWDYKLGEQVALGGLLGSIMGAGANVGAIADAVNAANDMGMTPEEIRRVYDQVVEQMAAQSNVIPPQTEAQQVEMMREQMEDPRPQLEVANEQNVPEEQRQPEDDQAQGDGDPVQAQVQVPRVPEESPVQQPEAGAGTEAEVPVERSTQIDDKVAEAIENVPRSNRVAPDKGNVEEAKSSVRVENQADPVESAHIDDLVDDMLNAETEQEYTERLYVLRREYPNTSETSFGKIRQTWELSKGIDDDYKQRRNTVQRDLLKQRASELGINTRQSSNDLLEQIRAVESQQETPADQPPLAAYEEMTAEDREQEARAELSIIERAERKREFEARMEAGKPKEEAPKIGKKPKTEAPLKNAPAKERGGRTYTPGKYTTVIDAIISMGGIKGVGTARDNAKSKGRKLGGEYDGIIGARETPSMRKKLDLTFGVFRSSGLSVDEMMMELQRKFPGKFPDATSYDDMWNVILSEIKAHDEAKPGEGAEDLTEGEHEARQAEEALNRKLEQEWMEENAGDAYEPEYVDELEDVTSFDVDLLSQPESQDILPIPQKPVEQPKVEAPAPKKKGKKSAFSEKYAADQAYKETRREMAEERKAKAEARRNEPVDPNRTYYFKGHGDAKFLDVKAGDTVTDTYGRTWKFAHIGEQDVVYVTNTKGEKVRLYRRTINGVYDAASTQSRREGAEKVEPPAKAPEGEGLRYDPSTNRHNGTKLTRGDVLVGDDGTRYALDRDQGFMLTIDEIDANNKPVGKSYSASVDPTDKSRFLNLRPEGVNVYEAPAPAKSKGKQAKQQDLIPEAEQPFNLMPPVTVPDGERIMREREEAAKAQKEFDDKQVDLPMGEKPKVKTPAKNLSEKDQTKLDDLKKEWQRSVGGFAKMPNPIEMAYIGGQIAALYVKGGVKTFAQFAESVKADMPEMWDNVKDFLHDSWVNARKSDKSLDDVLQDAAQDAIERIDRGEPAQDIPKPEKPIPANVTSLQERVAKTQREGEYEPGGQPTWKALRDNADTAFKKDPLAGVKLFERITNEGYLPDDQDIAIMTMEVARRKITRNEAIRRLDELIEQGASASEIAQAEKVLSEASAYLNAAYDITAVGNDAVTGDARFKSRLGAALNALKMTVDERFELVNLVADYRAAKGRTGGESQAELDALKKVADDYKASNESYQKAVEKLEAEQAKLIEENKGMDAEIERLRRQTILDSAISSYEAMKKRTEKIAGFKEVGIRMIEEERQRRANRLKKASDVTQFFIEELAGAVKMAVGHFIVGTANIADVIVKEYGDFGKDNLDEILRQGYMQYAQTVDDAERQAERPKGEQPKETRTPKKGKPEQIIKGLYNFLIENDVTDIDEATSQVKELIDEHYPDLSALTENEIETIFSDYGKKVKERKDPFAQVRVKLRREAQLRQAIVDAELGIPPKKSGKKRFPDAPEVRELKKILHQIMREKGIKPKNEGEIRSAMQAIETRLANEIDRLTRALEEKEPIPGPRAPEPYSDTAKERLARRNELKAQYDRMFPKDKRLTPEQQLDIAITYADKMLAKVIQEHSDAAKGIFKKKGRKQELPPSQQLEALNVSIAAIRSEIANMRAMNPVYAIQDEIVKINRTIKTLERKMATGEFWAKPPREPVDITSSPEAMAAAAELAEVKFRYAQMKHLASRPFTPTHVKVGEAILAGQDVIKTIFGSIDLSALGVHGGMVMLMQPGLWSKAVIPAIQTTFSARISAEIYAKMTQKKNFKNGAYKTAKLRLADGDGKGNFVGRIEDMFRPDLAAKFAPFNASQRSFATTLNELRSNLFDRFMEMTSDPNDYNAEKLKAIGNMVNALTGASTMIDAGKFLSFVMWSPSLSQAPFQILSGKGLLWGIETKAMKLQGNEKYAKDVRRIYIRQLLNMARTLGLVWSAAAIMNYLNGDDDDNFEVLLHPKYLTNGLWGTIKIGNVRWSPLSHLPTAFAPLSALASGRVTTSSGDVKVWHKWAPMATDAQKADKSAQRWYKPVQSWMMGKRNPALGLLWEIITGKDFAGREIPLTETLKQIGPIAPYETIDLVKIQENLSDLAFTIALSAIGQRLRKDYNDPSTVKALDHNWERKFNNTIWTGTTSRTAIRDRARYKSYMAEQRKIEGITREQLVAADKAIFEAIREDDQRQQQRAREYFDFLVSEGMTRKEIYTMFRKHGLEVEKVKPETIDDHWRTLFAIKPSKKRK